MGASTLQSRLGQWAVSIFIVFHSLMLVLENTKPSAIYAPDGNIFSTYAKAIGQNQTWDMFTVDPVRPKSFQLESVRGSERHPLALTWPEAQDPPHMKVASFFLNILDRKWNATAMAYFDGAVAGLLERGEEADQLILTYRGRGVMDVRSLAPNEAVTVPTERALILAFYRIDHGVARPMPAVLAGDARFRDALDVRSSAPSHSLNLRAVLMRGAETACGGRPRAERVELRIERLGDPMGPTLAGVVQCPP